MCLLKVFISKIITLYNKIIKLLHFIGVCYNAYKTTWAKRTTYS